MTRKQQKETGKSLHQQDVKVDRSRFHRLARAGFYVILAGAITAGGVLLFTLDSQDQAVALGEPMDPPMPEPGGARAWEVEIPISTYSRVHTRTGNVITRIPIIGWTGAGPAMNMVLYHNAATVDSTLPLTDGMGFDLVLRHP